MKGNRRPVDLARQLIAGVLGATARLATEDVLAVLGRGIAAIATERIRQQVGEGFTLEHDAQRGAAELARAAACYAYHASLGDDDRSTHGPLQAWPWAREWWKPKTRERDLERAGALLAAALDVLACHAGAVPRATLEHCPPVTAADLPTGEVTP